MQSTLNKPKKILVLGAGRVGKAIAFDLSDRYDVTAVDANATITKQIKDAQFKVINKDVTDRDTLASLLADVDLVINALPGHLGFKILKNIIENGKRAVDISFFPEDSFELDEPAKNKKVAATVDCGVAPGLNNIICGFHHKQMKMKSFACYVGGLPKNRFWPYQYKAPFSPIDVIEEYVRPARFVENGEIITKPALSDLEHIDFDGVGTLEAFNTDGLRTLLKTVKIPDMREKTLRYPGHGEYMKVLRETGFFSNQTINIKGVEVSPLEITSRVLFPHWQLAEGEEEFTIMRIIIEGEEDGAQVRYIYNLYDEYDKNTRLTSMARTTGFTCAAIATLILEGKIDTAGVVLPESIGADKVLFDEILNYLRNRNIHLEVTKNIIK